MRESFLFTSFLILGMGSLPALGFTIDAKKEIFIVTGEEPSNISSQAAQILRNYLERITGKKFPILMENRVQEKKYDGLILVGETSLGEEKIQLNPEEVLIKSKENTLILRGGDIDEKTSQRYKGTIYAVYEFLEKYCGIRWFWPGEKGTVIPKVSTLSLDSFSYRYQPPIAQRKIRNPLIEERNRIGAEHLGIPFQEYEKVWRTTGEWFNTQKLGTRLNIRYGHAFGKLWKEYGKSHPEWFALQPDGTRIQSESEDYNRARLCVSNRELIEEIARIKIEELKAHPEYDSVSICPNDGGKPTFCMGSECEKLDSPEGREIELRGWGEYISLTDRYVYFFNGIAERVSEVFPEKLLGIYAYSAYSDPPLKRELHPNLVVGFVPGNYFHEEERKKLRGNWEGWREMGAQRIFWRPNIFHGGHGFPAIYVHKLADDLKYFLQNGMIATDFDSCLHHWATQGLNYYVTARLLWNPDLEVDEIVKDYCERGFGNAAPAIMEYFDEVEKLTNRIAESNIGGSIKTEFREKAPGFYLPFVSKGRRILAKARALVENDEEVLSRIDFLEKGLDYTEAQAQSLLFLRENWKNWRACDNPENKKILDNRYQTLREIFFTEPLAVNVVHLTWRDGGYWKYTGWQWLKSQ